MKRRDLIAGLLFFIAVGIAFYFAMNLQGDGTLRLPWNETSTSYKITFSNVQGLSQNSPVWVSGVSKGKVKDMFVDPQTGVVEVHISLESNITLNKDAYAEIIPASVFGGKAIALYLGDDPQEHDRNIPVRGVVVEDLFTAAGRGLSKINDGIDEAVETIKNVNRIVKDVKEGRGVLGTVLSDEEVAGDIKATAKNIRVMSEDAKGSISNIKDITEKVNSGDGVATLLIDDADTAMRFKKIVRNLEDTSDNTVGATRSIKSIVQKVDDGKGFFGVLLNDEETGENIRQAVAETPETIRSIRKVTDETGILVENVNRGEGTIGKLFTDDTLFNDTLNAINTLRSGFEDIREQAPITTFASLLFNVFQ